ncbi:DUF6894 family protein, partial [Bradyrhizobium rifense]|uniref:DUF6894 family protein n=1 Tax=Bradyrhizobium rifense TaxID=515499 RepID=UPI001AEE45D5
MDGTALIDETGVELPDIAVARSEAIKLAAGVLREGLAGHFWEGHPWQLVVTDSSSPTAGTTYFAFTFSVKESALPRHQTEITSGYGMLARVLAAMEPANIEARCHSACNIGSDAYSM